LVGQRVVAILRRSSTSSFSGMLTRNGRIAVPSVAALANFGDAAPTTVAARAIKPVRRADSNPSARHVTAPKTKILARKLTRCVGRSSYLMLSSLSA
jgi:hypothetical protein